MTFDLGDNPTHVVSPDILTLNQDHVIIAGVAGRMGSLQVDGGKVYQNEAEGSYDVGLALSPQSYVGGVAPTLVIPGEVPTIQGISLYS